MPILTKIQDFGEFVRHGGTQTKSRIPVFGRFRSKSILWGFSVWARKALNDRSGSLWSPARAVPRGCHPRAGASRARSHCHSASLLNHSIPNSLTYSVSLILKRQRDRTPGAPPHHGRGRRGEPRRPGGGGGHGLKPLLGEVARPYGYNALSGYMRSLPHIFETHHPDFGPGHPGAVKLIAWSVDVQCDTCQLNIVSGLPKVACEKVSSTHTVALAEFASRTLLVKVHLKE
jgi:hypothetical protein